MHCSQLDHPSTPTAVPSHPQAHRGRGHTTGLVRWPSKGNSALVPSHFSGVVSIPARHPLLCPMPKTRLRVSEWETPPPESRFATIYLHHWPPVDSLMLNTLIRTAPHPLHFPLTSRNTGDRSSHVSDVCVCARARTRVCMCVCVCARVYNCGTCTDVYAWVHVWCPCFYWLVSQCTSYLFLFGGGGGVFSSTCHKPTTLSQPGLKTPLSLKGLNFTSNLLTHIYIYNIYIKYTLNTSVHLCLCVWYRGEWGTEWYIYICNALVN